MIAGDYFRAGLQQLLGGDLTALAELVNILEEERDSRREALHDALYRLHHGHVRKLRGEGLNYHERRVREDAGMASLQDDYWRYLSWVEFTDAIKRDFWLELAGGDIISVIREAQSVVDPQAQAAVLASSPDTHRLPPKFRPLYEAIESPTDTDGMLDEYAGDSLSVGTQQTPEGETHA